MRTTIALNYLIVSCLSQAWGFQAPAAAPEPDGIHDALSRLPVARTLRATDTGAAARIMRAGVKELALIGVLAPAHVRSVLTDLERKRIDKQPGAGSSAGGSTSLVEHGTVPTLLGAAVENGP